MTPRVLIVDDHPSFRHAARELLEARGYAVVAEADGSVAALEALELLEPDAVLLDVRLGAESGFEIARELTRARPGSPCCWSPRTSRTPARRAFSSAARAGSY